MLLKTAEKSDEIKLLEIVGSEIKSANLVRVLIAGVETRFNSSREIFSAVVFVKVPCIWTMCRLSAPAKPSTAEMFKPVMLTNSPSAAREVAIGIPKYEAPMASNNRNEARRVRAK